MAHHLIPSNATTKSIEAGDARHRLTDGAGLYLRLFVKGGSHGRRFDYSLNGRRAEAARLRQVDDHCPRLSWHGINATARMRLAIHADASLAAQPPTSHPSRTAVGGRLAADCAIGRRHRDIVQAAKRTLS
jgi:hypothetical protein